MSSPQVRAFFFGRAVANMLLEQLEDAFTDALSELGKFDAEQREKMRSFVNQAQDRALADEQGAMLGSRSALVKTGSDDLQATIDELRAEVAQLRSELQRYRSSRQG
ncbi:DUF6825 family protein [Leptolyngbya sp. FACHB-261]|uniref:DUF6825 family protein n=1 Tax=Leptolyngbya sp. FACHB-261 TaxID=2692806 RepID=UPI0016870950|nr:hypothetical protein [Leptolyngbya sp. FACHB-261]MBD2099284.1 hypothetical protein [Leptolyngbya sp. FACHB-261]